MTAPRALMALCLVAASPAAALPPEGTASIEVVITPRTEGVSVSFTVDQSDHEMDAKKPGELYQGQVDMSASDAGPPPISMPVDILASTPARSSLQLYGLVRHGEKSTVTFRVFVPEPSRTDVAEVNRIDQLFQTSKDSRTLTEVYFVSREIYRHYAAVSPDHVVAIRAAKLWFDSAYQLATTGKLPRYRMDQKARDVLEDYEKRAGSDANLAAKLRPIMVRGYVSGMAQHLDTLVFRDAAMVADLVAEGKLESAKKLNEDLLQTFTALPVPQQQAAMKLQGVSVDSLKANKAFITSLTDTRTRAAAVENP